MKVFVKTLQGLEEVLEKEIIDLGGENVVKQRRAVSCEGNLEFVYKANYELRTALSVLIPVYSFTARNDNELYSKVRDHDWSRYLDIHKTFALHETIFSEFFKHGKYTALRVKDAIVDQFRDKFRQRPDIDRERPDVIFNVYAYKDKFTVSLDSSGESLHKRGYREPGHEAPLNEVLAAGLLKLSEWDTTTPLLDPMCGSGTFLLEGAMMAFNMPPQYARRDFGFRTWANFSPMLWNKVKLEADAKFRKTGLPIWGGDLDPESVKLARQSIRKLGLRRDIALSEKHFEDQFAKQETGTIITNPPYGERIGEEVEALYKAMGSWLKHKFSGYDAWLLSSNKKALKQLGLKPTEQITVLNGKLECEFCKYELYDGSKSS